MELTSGLKWWFRKSRGARGLPWPWLLVPRGSALVAKEAERCIDTHCSARGEALRLRLVKLPWAPRALVEAERVTRGAWPAPPARPGAPGCQVSASMPSRSSDGSLWELLRLWQSVRRCLPGGGSVAALRAPEDRVWGDGVTDAMGAPCAIGDADPACRWGRGPGCSGGPLPRALLGDRVLPICVGGRQAMAWSLLPPHPGTCGLGVPGGCCGLPLCA
mmetsp:Transcript_5700/g.16282  ORF Transcript_5700/g.16282 Transcript_5700/m.16282 type:complete len:218 (-) Transcript_5700:2194-2847(-)